MKHQGCQMAKKLSLSIEQNTLKSLLDDGLSVRDIAKKYNVSAMTISRLLKKSGIQIKAVFNPDTSHIDQAVEQSLSKLKKIKLPIDIDKIIKSYGLKIKYLDFDNDLSAMLVKQTIYINKNEYKTNEARANFSKAHELGHFVLHNVEAHEFKPVRFRSSGIEDQEKIREREANQFGASLLMPESLLEKAIGDKSELTEDDIRDLAKQFNVSFTAMSIRLSSFGFLI